MSNNKQSSVESLFQKLWDTPKVKGFWNAILEEHKAKHKEEIIDAHTIGYVIGGGNGDLHESKEYYNERFGEQQDTEYGSYKEVIEMVQSLDFKTILKQYAETEEVRQTIAEMNKAMGVKMMTNNNNIPGTIPKTLPNPKADLETVTFIFTQETNCVDGPSNEIETLTVEAKSSLGIDGDGGAFYVLRTEQWAIDGTDEINEIISRCERAIKAIVK